MLPLVKQEVAARWQCERCEYTQNFACTPVLLLCAQAVNKPQTILIHGSGAGNPGFRALWHTGSKVTLVPWT